MAGVALFTGCGYVGQPLPPALNIPSRVTDLRMAEYGDKIVVEFTIPPLTTDGLPLKSVRSVELRVGPVSNPFNTDAWAAGAKRLEVPATAPGPLHHEIPAAEWIGQEVAIAVRAMGPKGKPSEWSTPRTLPVQPPLKQPADLKLENVEPGIRITWSGTSAHYRVFRVAGDGKPEQIAETDKPEYVDGPVQYGMRYQYFVQAIAGELQQSEISGPVPITPEDKFPPAVPAGLTAVAGVNTIELAWQRNTEPDFKGYNVYRSVEAGPFEKVATLIDAPVYSDRQVEAGKKYRYAVTAVDLTGNESERSPVQEATAQ